jgi:hypothetical protein
VPPKVRYADGTTGPAAPVLPGNHAFAGRSLVQLLGSMEANGVAAEHRCMEAGAWLRVWWRVRGAVGARGWTRGG